VTPVFDSYRHDVDVTLIEEAVEHVMNLDREDGGSRAMGVQSYPLENKYEEYLEETYAKADPTVFNMFLGRNEQSGRFMVYEGGDDVSVSKLMSHVKVLSADVRDCLETFVREKNPNFDSKSHQSNMKMAVFVKNYFKNTKVKNSVQYIHTDFFNLKYKFPVCVGILALGEDLDIDLCSLLDFESIEEAYENGTIEEYMIPYTVPEGCLLIMTGFAAHRGRLKGHKTRAIFYAFTHGTESLRKDEFGHVLYEVKKMVRVYLLKIQKTG